MAGHFYLKRVGSGLPESVTTHLDGLAERALGEADLLPGHPDLYVFRADELRALLANSLITGAVQAAYDIRTSQIEAASLRSSLETIFQPTAASDDAASAM